MEGLLDNDVDGVLDSVGVIDIVGVAVALGEDEIDMLIEGVTLLVTDVVGVEVKLGVGEEDIESETDEVGVAVAVEVVEEVGDGLGDGDSRIITFFLIILGGSLFPTIFS